MLLYVALVFIIILGICFSIPKARNIYITAAGDIFDTTKSILEDFFVSPFKESIKWKSLLELPLCLVIFVLAVALFLVLLIAVIPIVAIIKAFISPERKSTGKEIKTTTPEQDFLSFKTPIRYSVPLEELSFDPSSYEVIYYNPSEDTRYDEIVQKNLEELKRIFSSSGRRFIYLPDYNKEKASSDLNEQIVYANPGLGDSIPHYQAITYSDIAEAYHIPNEITEPCLVRCMSADGDRGFRLWGGKTDLTGISFDESALYFSIKLLESNDKDSFISEVKTYLRNCYSGPLYHIDSDEETEAKLAGLSADERFDDDVYIIGREICERIGKLRARGLSSLAIRKLIGDDSDKPGKLLIDKHHKLFLTDFGNKEIKMEPLQKAVFFLFLRHPEGIYFKDLADYRDELDTIYKEITGREDTAGIERSIRRLTDPLDNSINEKCARIKNAFVSEFREEVAQWYFIDGTKGEKKSIKLPRELVTWEIKD